MHAELRIRQILESPTSISDKVHVLVEEARAQVGQGRDEEALRAAIGFLSNSGHIQELASVFAILLDQREKIPWGHFLDLLGQSGLNFPPSTLQSIEKGLRRQDALSAVWAVDSFDEYFPEFIAIRKTLGKEYQRAAQARKSELLEKFEFLRNQRLEAEARQVLRILRSSYPEDAEIQSLATDFDENRAREILSDFQHEEEETETYRPRFQVDELKALEFWRQELLKAGKDHPEALLDLSLFFLFLEDYESSLELLRGKEALNFSEDWLKADLLKSARRFVEALQQADELAGFYADDSDTLVATIYFRAEVLGEMGQYSKAIELLESIAKVRPQYRSTIHLIQSFKSKGARR